MLNSAALPVFVLASFVVLVAPGPAVLFVVTRSLDQGRRAGVASSLGLGLGILVHAVATTAGLSALLVSSAVAYTAVKLAGAAYLVYLGIGTLVRREEPGALRVASDAPHRQLLLQGLAINVMNPKVALFFLAFLPQFTDPSRGPLVPQLAVLGLLFVVMGTAVDVGYALLAGTAGVWLRRSPVVSRARKYVTGSVYVGLGLFTAAARER